MTVAEQIEFQPLNSACGTLVGLLRFGGSLVLVGYFIYDFSFLVFLISFISDATAK
jgi:hypothetical protein